MTDFNEALCTEKHSDINRRLTSVEQILEKVKDRPPVWATIVITVLSSATTGLLVDILKSGGH